MKDNIIFANQLADVAGDIARRYFRTSCAVENKEDASPVTQADREAEAAMRVLIKAHDPTCGIWGEEYGAENLDAENVWVLDPIDGTLSFIAGLPTFGILISLVRQGKPVLGVIDQPILLERWIGVHDEPTQFNSKPTSTNQNVTLKQALISTTSPDLLKTDERKAFERVRAKAQKTVYGYDCYAYAQLASGHIHAVIETGLKPHDFCALAPVVNGAGGVMTDWDGNPITMRSDGKVIAAANLALHTEILGLITG